MPEFRDELQKRIATTVFLERLNDLKREIAAIETYADVLGLNGSKFYVDATAACHVLYDGVAQLESAASG